MIAAGHGHVETVKVLLAGEIEVDHKSKVTPILCVFAGTIVIRSRVHAVDRV